MRAGAAAAAAAAAAACTCVRAMEGGGSWPLRLPSVEQPVMPRTSFLQIWVSATRSISDRSLPAWAWPVTASIRQRMSCCCTVGVSTSWPYSAAMMASTRICSHICSSCRPIPPTNGTKPTTNRAVASVQPLPPMSAHRSTALSISPSASSRSRIDSRQQLFSMPGSPLTARLVSARSDLSRYPASMISPWGTGSGLSLAATFASSSATTRSTTAYCR